MKTANNNLMKGFGHAVSKRDSSGGPSESLHKRGKLVHTEGSLVDRCCGSFRTLNLSDVLVLGCRHGRVAVDHDKSRSSGPYIAFPNHRF